MATLEHPHPSPQKKLERPTLVFFHSSVSGRCRRVEGFLAQVLQRGGNHQTFSIRKVTIEDQPDLCQRLGVAEVPTLAVVEGKVLTARLVSPSGCREIEKFLQPWLH